MTEHQSNAWNDRGLLVLRIGIGLVFVLHGWQKAVVMGPEGVAGFFSGVGIPFPYANAVFITALEFLGGIALMAGALTRVVAPLLASTMVVAITTVHFANGFFASNGGYEYPLSLLAVALALTATGAGAYSVDARLPSRRTRPVGGRRHALDVAA